MNAMNWGLIGGGEGSQIGFAHRAGSSLDRKFSFVAGALDVDPERGRQFALSLGLDKSRAYGDWREMLRKGFAECFRVLKHDGVLVFKWCEDEIPVSQILALTPEKPLFGNRCGKNAKTHWVTFLKQNTEMTGANPNKGQSHER